MLTALPDEAVLGFNTRDGLNALISLTTGQFNTGIGFAALKVDHSGSNNTAVGAQALLQNTIGSYNTAIGENAMVSNSDGNQNMALGQGALANNLHGNFNTAMGFQALNSNTVDDNTAVGWKALVSNTTGDDNTATGEEALLSNTIGFNNTAFGGLALSTNTTVNNNTAVGWKALQFSNPPAGSDPNTAVGSLALLHNTTGADNDAFGFQALNANTDGGTNAAFGAFALFSNTHGGLNVAFGSAALGGNIVGFGNTAVGVDAGLNITSNLNIDIGAGVEGLATDLATTRIGQATGPFAQTACFIGGISGVNEGGSGILPVYINNAGRLGTNASSRRFKNEIKPMEKTSEGILGLKPVTFHYKDDNTGTPQFGLIAEDVEKVNADLVVRDNKCEIYTVRYDAVNAMLLNEFLKEHRTVQDLKSTVAKQEKQIEALTTGLQKVSDQLELSKPAPRTVDNNR